MAHLKDLQAIRAALAGARTIAVLGAHPSRQRPAFYVPDYLSRRGYRILPVNPTLPTGTRLWDEPVRGRLVDLPGPVDMVDVFRRPDALPGHLDDILAMSPLPRTVWLQLGVRHDAFADDLVAAGIDVVQDRCTYADHRGFGLDDRAG